MNCLRISPSVLSHLVLHRKPAAVCHTPLLRRFYHTFFRALRDGSHRSPALQARRCYQHTQRNKQKELTRFDGSRRRRGRSRWHEPVGAAILVTGAAGVAASSLCSREAVPYTDRTRLIIFSPKFERWIGETVFNSEKEKLGPKVLSPLEPESVRVRRIASEIVAAVHQQAPLMSPPREVVINDDWGVIVVKDNRVNAMCVPGGKIIVFTGLLDEFKEDAEVATILGHEVGHAVARHGAEKLTTLLWIIILEIVIVQFINIPDKVIEVMSKYLLELPYSRRKEMEADHVGLMLLAAAGYDPRVAPSVYERLGGGDSEVDNYISTHPSSKKRSQLLSRQHVMSEALELYRQVIRNRQAAGAKGSLPDSARTKVIKYGKETGKDSVVPMPKK